MPTSVRMPNLGESITEGTITRWLKQEGDHVAVDEPLFEVSTDKVDTEVPSPVAGTLQAIKAGVDATVEVGAEVAVIEDGAAAEAAPAAPAATAPPAPPAPEAAAARPTPPQPAAAAPAPAQPAAAPAAVGTPPPAPAGPEPPGGAASPLVRRLARENHVDLRDVPATGGGGRVRREDVLAYVEQRGAPPTPPAVSPAAPVTPAAPAPAASAAGARETVVPATRLRRLIAERMVGSLQTSAQLTAAVEVDMTGVMRVRERAREEFKRREGIPLSPLPFSVLALIAAAREYPVANSALDADGNLHLYQDVHLGVAVDTPKGLFVPVIKHADTLNLTGLARAIADVAARTRAGRINPDELSGSTVTITNTGSVGTVWDTPIINQPNSLIFATPAIVKRPVVIDDPELGEIVAVRQMMYAIVTYDHRILDGADAARFLGKVKEFLETSDFSAELELDG